MNVKTLKRMNVKTWERVNVGTCECGNVGTEALYSLTKLVIYITIFFVTRFIVMIDPVCWEVCDESF